MISKVSFIIFYTTFVFFITTFSSFVGTELIENAPSAPTIPEEPTIIDYIVYPIQNISYFFSLMRVSSEFTLLGFLLIPLTIGFLWALFELIRGV